VGYLISQ